MKYTRNHRYDKDLLEFNQNSNTYACTAIYNSKERYWRVLIEYYNEYFKRIVIFSYFYKITTFAKIQGIKLTFSNPGK